jgi:hypothetical protein
MKMKGIDGVMKISGENKRRHNNLKALMAKIAWHGKRQ